VAKEEEAAKDGWGVEDWVQEVTASARRVEPKCLTREEFPVLNKPVPNAEPKCPVRKNINAYL